MQIMSSASCCTSQVPSHCLWLPRTKTALCAQRGMVARLGAKLPSNQAQTSAASRKRPAWTGSFLTRHRHLH